jgi:hypothetical protein
MTSGEESSRLMVPDCRWLSAYGSDATSSRAVGISTSVILISFIVAFCWIFYCLCCFGYVERDNALWIAHAAALTIDLRHVYRQCSWGASIVDESGEDFSDFIESLPSNERKICIEKLVQTKVSPPVGQLVRLLSKREVNERLHLPYCFDSEICSWIFVPERCHLYFASRSN